MKIKICFGRTEKNLFCMYTGYHWIFRSFSVVIFGTLIWHCWQPVNSVVCRECQGFHEIHFILNLITSLSRLFCNVVKVVYMLQVPPFPTTTMSPLVSRTTSPSQSRSASPHRTPISTRHVPPPPPNIIPLPMLDQKIVSENSDQRKLLYMWQKVFTTWRALLNPLLDV